MITKWIPQFEKLAETYRQKVEEQFEILPLGEIKETYEEVYVSPKEMDMTTVEEVPFVDANGLDMDKVSGAAKEAVKKGEVAVLLMAGGQGTRLEHPGPKGTFSFDGKSLFEMQAAQIKSAEHEAERPIHWYIMTSDINHTETLEFFSEHNYFGFETENIHFFRQEHFPALSKDGELLLTAEKEIMLTPNGNGGIFSALKASGMLEDMHSRGIKDVFMNNVDNAVVKVLDPVLLGLHISEDNDVTSKSILPRPGESVGRLSLVNGEKSVVEYTELPEGAEEQFQNGNIGIHVFGMDYLNKVAEEKVPYHLALKKMEHLNKDMLVVKDEVLKFEKFYFDAFRHASKHMTLQVERKGEFSPLKNKVGKDSIETAYNDLKDQGII